MRLHLSRDPERIAQLGKNLFGTTTAEETITSLEAFFQSIQSPVRLSECGIDVKDKGEEIFSTFRSNKVGGNHHKLNDADYRELIRLMA
jgi:alcohol dehydrogenase YqhD (iron-dependent ADH family)